MIQESSWWHWFLQRGNFFLSRKCSYLLNWISWLKTTYVSLWQKWKVNFLIGQLFYYLKIALLSHIGEYVAILIHV